MRRWLAALMLVAAPAAAQTGPTTDVVQTDAAAKARIDAAVAASGFAGVYTVYRGPRRITAGSVGAAVVGQPGGFVAEGFWPWAAVTRQVVATMAMQEVDKGRLSLDVPADSYLPELGAGAPTLRRLLQYRDASSVPENGDATGLARCVAGGAWRHDDCRYVVVGAILERTTRTALPALFAQRIAAPLGLTARFATAAPAGVDEAWAGGPGAAERAALVRLGAAGGLIGTAGDMAAFDRALLAGSLLTPSALATMWAGDPALGQSSFTVPLKGCAAPVRIVERRGAIGRFQVRNVILPDLGLAIVLLTNRGEFDFGDVRQGKGRGHAILSAAACA